jgi:predicted nucleotidyltransferase
MLNPELLAKVAKRLDPLGLNYAFVGGSIVEFLLDRPDLTPVRPTDDLDIIVEIMAHRRYSDLEEILRQAGFQHDMTVDAPRCRWRLDGLIVDVMPTEDALLGLNTTWFVEALATAKPRRILGVDVPLISAVAFLATKLAAFADRGDGDYYGSHDLEDIITVIDGRAAIVAEIAEAAPELQAYVVGRMKALGADSAFQDALAGHLPSDGASQARLPMLRKRLGLLAAL